MYMYKFWFEIFLIKYVLQHLPVFQMFSKEDVFLKSCGERLYLDNIIIVKTKADLACVTTKLNNSIKIWWQEEKKLPFLFVSFSVCYILQHQEFLLSEKTSLVILSLCTVNVKKWREVLLLSLDIKCHQHHNSSLP